MQLKSKYLKYLLPVLILLVVIGLGFVVLQKIGFIESFKLAMQIQQQNSLSVEDFKVLERLGEIINLPKNITPTMAVVTDVVKLRVEQPVFFADAKNGDRLIIYPEKAIIYDYVSNKIINVGPVVSVDNTKAPVKDKNSDIKTSAK